MHWQGLQTAQPSCKRPLNCSCVMCEKALCIVKRPCATRRHFAWDAVAFQSIQSHSHDPAATQVHEASEVLQHEAMHVARSELSNICLNSPTIGASLVTRSCPLQADHFKTSIDERRVCARRRLCGAPAFSRREYEGCLPGIKKPAERCYELRRAADLRVAPVRCGGQIKGH